jgi:polyketide synthase PksN
MRGKVLSMKIRKQDIAIIGMACRFPGAPNYRAFWQSLCDKVSNEQAIPSERWDWQTHVSDLPEELRASNRWGNFIQDIDKFDAAFFNISPKEATLIDPQQRIMLEIAWACFEDAGYTTKRLAGSETGVFIGVCNYDYKELLEKDGSRMEGHAATGTFNTLIANRLSYFYDLRGPSVPVDTACSSSLVALHQAVQAIQAGDCKMALAGGINVLLTPTSYVSFSKLGMLSPDGRCKTFAATANGYVRGEGAGLVLLKSLDQAVKDGDRIVGIIKGSAVNHGGYARTLTSPNPSVQAQLIVKACQVADITPDTLSYIETHGTGTKLGDPIEIGGLKSAFKQAWPSKALVSYEQAFCGLGSVKTNIGHLEAAAGIAGVIKVLLAMRHQQLPGTVHFDELNPHIELAKTPFYIVANTQPWQAIKSKWNNKNLPRRAGISSFGFGGANAHIILEEYSQTLHKTTPAKPYYLLTLSAKNPETLQRRLEDLSAYLQQHPELPLAAIAYTLNKCRDHFKYRCALVVKTTAELQTLLLQIRRGENPEHYVANQTKVLKEQAIGLQQQLLKRVIELHKKFIKPESYKNKLLEIADLYTKGLEPAWENFYPEAGQCISLPTYPFLKKRYWVDNAPHHSPPPMLNKKTFLHPLLENDASISPDYQYQTNLSGSEFFLQDHIVHGQKLLPGVCCLEMARAASQLALPTEQVIGIKNVSWLRPIMVSSPLEIAISLQQQAEQVSYQITSDKGGIVHSEGELILGAVPAPEHLDIDALSVNYDRIANSDELYQYANKQGLAYGASFQALQWLKTDGETALAYVQLPVAAQNTADRTQYSLHPSLLDNVLQTALGLQLLQNQAEVAFLPVALQHLQLYNSLPDAFFVLVQQEADKAGRIRRYHYTVIDEQGVVILKIQGLSMMLMQQTAISDLRFYTTEWQESALTDKQAIDKVLVIGADAAQLEALSSKLGDKLNSLQLTAKQDYIAAVNDLPADLSHVLYQTNNSLPDVMDFFAFTQALLKSKRYKRLNLYYTCQANVNLPFTGMTNGFAKVLSLEHPAYACRVLTLQTADVQQWATLLINEMMQPSVGTEVIQYTADKRFKEQLVEWAKPTHSKANMLRQQGVYLITGGLGGLGLIFAKYLAKHYQAKLILTSRAELNAAKQQAIAQLEALGSEVLYIAGDIAKEDDVNYIITEAKARFGMIHGIIHSAGLIKDSLLINKTLEDFVQVLAPKVQGAIYLDKFTENEPLDFMVLFSSVVSIFGNVGQADYASANAFLDSFASWRNSLHESGKRFGKTIAINWPLWQEGGMQVSDAVKAYLQESLGILPLPTEQGVDAFITLLTTNFSQGIVSYKQDIKQANTVAQTTGLGQFKRDLGKIELKQSELMAKTQTYLINLIQEKLNFLEEISLDIPFTEYGIDSILVFELTHALEKDFGILPKTLFFEYQDLDALTEYFMQEHGIALQQKFAPQTQPEQLAACEVMRPVEPALAPESHESLSTRPDANQTPGEQEPIAIIGLSGHYPQADNLTEFWENLKAGKDCITEVPSERWDWQDYYDAEKGKPGKSYGKWGSFLSDYDKFDPLFFNINPSEAELIDPQERLFLQVAWHALEDAGYTPESLLAKTDSYNAVGVYVGVMYGHYQLYSEQDTVTSSYYASIANQVSYYLNLHGPSLAVDTMCSSSLTAIHLACDAIRHGQCQAAIAGGVNITSHPDKYLLLSQGHFLASDGYCKSFGEGGDGYVPGEGVGAVLLKPLAKALADGDRIYAIIKGTSINHGGRVNSYTVPNPIAQAEVVKDALKQAQIKPESISYLEAHGTGTSLGDPIEMRGLVKAFAGVANQSCPIGSVKSNLGHLESAAGIVALTKVLFQLKYKQLVPSIHSSSLNPHIDFSQTPFYVQQELSEWQLNGDHPRRAGISSFGAGGSNAHIIIEEAPLRPAFIYQNKPYYLLSLSAKHEKVLKQRITDLLIWLTKHEQENLHLENISYTLNACRSHFSWRCTLVVASLQELQDKLKQLQKQTKVSGCYYGRVDKKSVKAAISKQVLKASTEKLAGLAYSEVAAYKENLEALANLYSEGYDLDWHALHQGESQQKLSLPTYPFLKERYWIKLNKPILAEAMRGRLHPLVDYNASTLGAQRYVTILHSQAFYLADHIIAGNKLLPGAAYLEMARVAAKLAQPKAEGVRIKQIVWLQPMVVTDKLEVSIQLYPKDQGVSYEVTSLGGEVLHSQGELVYEQILSHEHVAIEPLKEQLAQVLEASAIYQQLSAQGFSYGPSFQVLQWLRTDGEQALGYLVLPEHLRQAADRGQYTIHPSLLDGALQSVIGLLSKPTEEVELYLPFAVDEIWLTEPLPDVCYVCVKNQPKQGKIKRYDIQIINEQGDVLLQIKGFSLKAMTQPKLAQSTLALYQPSWQAQAIIETNPVSHILAIGASAEQIERLQGKLNRQVSSHLPGNYASEQWPAELSHILYVSVADNAQEDAADIFRLTQALMQSKRYKGIRLLYVTTPGDNIPYGGMISGFAKTLTLENPYYQYKVIQLPQATIEEWAERVSAELPADFKGDTDIRYVGEQRYVQRLKQIDDIPQSSLPLRQQGVYLITGGLGGLGLIFAEYLAQHYQAKLILMGRSKLDTARQTAIAKLRTMGSEVLYLTGDITKQAEIMAIIQQAKAQFGNLHGIIHSAGIIKDSLLIKKSLADFYAVLAPKVQGTVNLDKVTAKEALDFVVLFSSIASVLGNAGQADYASANAFMDSFAHWRNSQVEQGKRFGKTLAINWPLWQEGGMQVDKASEEYLMQSLGMAILPTEQGLKVFEQILQQQLTQAVVAYGDITQLAGHLMPIVEQHPLPSETAILSMDIATAKTKLEQTLQQSVSQALKVRVEEVDSEEDLTSYGFDSVSFTKLVNQLNQLFNINLTPAILFEYPTLDQLATYLLAEYPGQLAKHYQTHVKVKAESRPQAIKVLAETNATIVAQPSLQPLPQQLDDMAIVGMQALLPGSQNVTELWQNLLDGKDLITEVPPERWDYKQYEDVPKWGGFIADIDRFDAEFFNISPHEAELMDPQQRLFLQIVWQAIEDAGYNTVELAKSKVGLFVGVCSQNYAELLQQQGIHEAHTSTGTTFSILANRVSYLLNLTGPSEAVDTACSSSLVALHRAIRAIQAGDCQSAVVGGVNALLTPSLFISFAKAGMLSPDGRCKTFDKAANGYVRGEGMGAIVLKPLAQAVADNDHIYAVIKSSSVNHGGHVNTLTAPNPNAQAALIIEAYQQANVSPESISYIEAHGTGTSLGDPIEVNGLKKAFQTLAKNQGTMLNEKTCGLGSIKANIGHLESAAGIAGLIKILLMLQHKTLVAQAQYKELNPYIDLAGSPFYIVDESKPWTVKEGVKRRAGMSSFGFGGANAHVLIEEAPEVKLKAHANKPYYVITLSAKQETVLQQKIQDLSQWLIGHQHLQLEDISYTLNIGRSHFGWRCALVAANLEELQDKLEQLQKSTKVPGCYYGLAAKEPANAAIYKQVLKASTEKLKSLDYSQRVDYSENLAALANLYVVGYDLDWHLLHQGESQQRLSLPGYPFLKERYWPELPLTTGASQTQLHPLLGYNASTLEAHCYTTVLQDNAYYLCDHVIAGNKLLPGVAYLEMARAAGQLAQPKAEVIGLKQVVWLQPVMVKDSLAVSIQLYPGNDQVNYEVTSQNGELLHSQGELIYGEALSLGRLELAVLNEQLEQVLQAEELYQQFRAKNFNYGSSFQTLQWLRSDGEQALGYLLLPNVVKQAADRKTYVMHPSLLDGALQAIIGLQATQDAEQYLPFALDEVWFTGALPDSCYVWVKQQTAQGKLQRYTIQVANEQGEVLVQINGLNLKARLQPTIAPSLELYQPSWQTQALVAAKPVNQLVAIGASAKQLEALQAKLNCQICSHLAIEQWPETLTHVVYVSALANAQEDAFKLFELTQAIMRSQRYKGMQLLYVTSQNDELPYAGMVTGFAKTLKLENPHYHYKVLQLPQAIAINEWADRVSAELQADVKDEAVIRYEGMQRYVEKLIQLETASQASLPLRQQGVYLLTGGLGGLGLQFAEYLAKHYQANLILTGRSELTASKQAALAKLSRFGTEVLYLAADMSQTTDVMAIIEQAKLKFGGLHGIIHAAGITNDGLLLNKHSEDFQQVLAPKVAGTVNLDKATANETLDFIVLFSSIASVLGNVGQSDYASANAFMDSFAYWRNSLVEQGKRFGKTLSINWPLWADGGMQVDAASQDYLAQHLGMQPLPTAQGLAAFEQLLQQPVTQGFVAYGDRAKFANWLKGPDMPSSIEVDATVDKGLLFANTQAYLKQLLKTTLKLADHKIKPDTTFEQYGIDSILVMSLTRTLEKDFGALPKTLFFEYQSLSALTDYFIAEHGVVLQQKFAEKLADLAQSKPHSVPARFTAQASKRLEIPAEQDESIAIIGLSGRYPQAKSLAEFWENLTAGHDSITEIPADRWNHQLYFDADKTKHGKSYSKWGGFIEDYDKFDPLFFNISPKEAELIDPQERLFLEIAWQAMEDAGYTPERLGQGYAATGQAVGVYVGVMYGPYQLYSTDTVATMSSYASIANRVSYCLNLHGPSVALDTMCSSSLTAIHMACESIRRGECQMALAGGVNISSHPNKYLLLSQGKFLASDGKCKSFGEGGDGYVPGEGVGAVLLKPLAKALADGDNIYGVIKGSSINHGGKVNGYTVPNPVAQSELIKDAFVKAQVEPASISYVEAHGTGTSLGDPIEIRGLVKAFNVAKQSCPIGSVKSNIGHLESAAGIAALSKVLLQLKHGQLVPSIHADSLNPHIDFAETPFIVQRQLTPWQPKAGYPQRACISSFGAGGSNAHLIIEQAPPQRLVEQPAKPYYLLTLSAKQQQALKQRIVDLRAWITALQDESKHSLANISYTLNAGRSHHAWRCALTVSSMADLSATLQQDLPLHYCDSDEESESIHDEKSLQTILTDLAQKHHSAANYKKNLQQLAELYCKGYDINWQQLHAGDTKQKLSLPGYPFAKERYWVDLPAYQPVLAAASRLHPLLDVNESGYHGIVYKKVLQPQDFYLADHKVKGQLLLPGTAYLEMACAAGTLAAGRPVLRLHEVMWLRPIICQDLPVTVWIQLTPNPDKNQAAFTIYSHTNSARIEHAQGWLSYAAHLDKLPLADLVAIQARCTYLGDKAKVYQQLAAMGFNYGTSFQLTHALYGSDEQALAKLVVPDVCQADFAAYQLHPSVLDAGLRAGFGIKHRINDASALTIPFYLAELNFYQALPMEVYAHTFLDTASNELKSNTLLYDKSGAVCVALNGFISRPLQEKQELPPYYFYQPVWREQAVVKQVAAESSLLLFLENEIIHKLVDTIHWPHTVIQVRPGSRFAVISHTSYTLRFDQPVDYHALFAHLMTTNLWPQTILHSLPSTVHQQPEHGVAAWLHLFQSWFATKRAEPMHYVGIYQASTQVNYQALASLGQAIKPLAPLFTLKLLGVESDSATLNLQAELLHRANETITYTKDQRLVRSLQETSLITHNSIKPALQKQGVYLITGGCGGIGRVVARDLANNYQAKLVLTGRSPLDGSKQAFLAELTALGAEVLYLAVDIGGDKNNVEQLVSSTLQHFGQLNGIIHAAGVVGATTLEKTTISEFSHDSRAKTAGILYLDEATKAIRLDFFVAFSSIASELGDSGIGSYAYGNRFMDNYIERRIGLVAQGLRYGKSLSIQWPYWAEGGMHLPEAEANIYFNYAGMQLLDSNAGLHVLNQALQAGSGTLMVVTGDKQRIERVLGLAAQSEPAALIEPLNSKTENDLLSMLYNYLSNLLSVTSKVPVNRIEVSQPLDNYGVDSVMLVTLNQRLSEDFPGIAKTLFFEHRTLKNLAAYLIQTYAERVNYLFNKQAAKQKPAMAADIQPTLQQIVSPLLQKDFNTADIAIIGISGRYPKANSLAEFWENLKAGRDCIEPVPRERWSHTTSYQGGFLTEIDKFDAAFFNLLPEEAELLAPELRLALETVWQTFEVAGLTRQQLTDYQELLHRGIGVFIANMYQQYGLTADELKITEQMSVYPPAMLANRISHFFNLQGPSLTLDAACAGSLTAIHMACESIRHGESSLAIAGGVNLHLHPAKYEVFGEAGLISKTHKSSGLGQGDGYVPGEGVGIVLLKSLQQAVEDNDTIYAVIKGGAINHGGNTPTQTLPNPQVQAQGLLQAIKQANIAANTITYVECAANGSPLGDALELRGLTNAFRQLTAGQHFCAVGTVKSNIGHLEAASGISQLTKVVYQLREGMLAPSIHAEPMNPDIDLSNSAFYLQKELAAWPQPVSENKLPAHPRRALISSFGAGGANAYLVVEEYQTPIKTVSALSVPQLFIFSAKTEFSLRAIISDMVDLLVEQPALSLIDMAYTLQIAREPMAWRIAAIAANQQELLAKLNEYLQQVKITNSSSFWENNVNACSESEQSHLRDLELIGLIVQKNDRVRLAKLWVQGAVIPWEQLDRQQQKPRRMALPTYAFDKQRFWLSKGVKAGLKSIAQFDERPVNIELTAIIEKVSNLLQNMLQQPLAQLNIHKPLTEYGIDSLRGLRLLNRINHFYKIVLEPSSLINFPTINELAQQVYAASQGLSLANPALAIASSNGLLDPVPEFIKRSRIALTKARVNKQPVHEQLLIKWLAKGLGLWLEHDELVVEHHASISLDKQLAELSTVAEAIAGGLDRGKRYYPLSFSQKMMCVQSELYQNQAYQLVVPFTVKKTLSLPLLNNALAILINRHQILRATFPKIQNVWVQVIHDELNLQVEVIDYSNSVIETKVIIQNLFKQEKHRGFNLSAGPLLHLKLVQLAQLRQVVLLNIHHAICDGIAVSLLANELSAIYVQLERGIQCQLPAMMAQYPHFVLEQLNNTDAMASEVEWWRQQLKDAPTNCKLPYDYPNNSKSLKQGKATFILINQAEKQGVDDFCRQENISLTLLVLSALYIAMQHWSKQQDIIIGTILNQRNRLEFEDVLGDFTNIVPIRAQLANTTTGRQLLKQVQAVFAQAYSHQKVSFSQLVRELSTQRNNANLPFYNIFLDSLNLLDFTAGEHETIIKADLFSYLSADSEVQALMDIFFLLMEQPEDWALTCIYRADLFKPETIAHFLANFRHVLQRMMTYPDQAIAEYFTQTEKQEVLEPVNLFCLSGADGSHDIFKRFLNHKEYYKPYAVKYKRTIKGIVTSSLEETARDVIQVTNSFKMPAPYALLGLSFGGAVAFEICHVLAEANMTRPQQLILLDAPPLVRDRQTLNQLKSTLNEGRTSQSLGLFMAMNWAVKTFGQPDSVLLTQHEFDKATSSLALTQQQRYAYQWIKTNTTMLLPALENFTAWSEQLMANIGSMLDYVAKPYMDNDIKITYIASDENYNPLSLLMPDLFPKVEVSKKAAWSQLFPNCEVDYVVVPDTDHYSLFSNTTAIAKLIKQVFQRDKIKVK